MAATIKFDRETYFQAHGRNGYLRTQGVEIADMDNGDKGDFAEIHLSPITSRGEVSMACRIPIRKSALPALIAELQKLVLDDIEPTGKHRLVSRRNPATGRWLKPRLEEVKD